MVAKTMVVPPISRRFDGGGVAFRRIACPTAGLLVLFFASSASAQPNMQIAQELNLVDSEEIVHLGQTVLGETSAHLFRLLNTGTQTLTINQIEVLGDFGFLFDAEATNVSVAPGSETILTVFFTGGGLFQGESTGGRSAGIRLFTNDPSVPGGFLFFVAGVVIEPPQPVMQAVLDGTVVGNNGLRNLGTAVVNQAVDFDVVVESIGSGPLAVTDVRIEEVPGATDSAAGDFLLVSGFNQTIERLDAATYTFRLQASTAGTRRANLVFENDSLQNPYTITVVGEIVGGPTLPGGLEPFMLVQDGLTEVQAGDTVHLGNVTVDQIASKTLSVLNVGQGALNVSELVVEGDLAPSFAVGINNANIPAGGPPAALGISFTPGSIVFGQATGPRAARVRLVTNDPAFTQDDYFFNVVATVIEPTNSTMQIVHDGTTIGNNGLRNLGPVDVGTTLPVDLSIESIGSDDLTVFQIRIEDIEGAADSAASDFELLSVGNQVVPRLDSLAVAIDFTPTAGGNRRCRLVVENDSLQNPYSVTLIGVGVAPVSDEQPPAPGGNDDPLPNPDDPDLPPPDEAFPVPTVPPMCGMGIGGMAPLMLAGLLSFRLGSGRAARRRNGM